MLGPASERSETVVKKSERPEGAPNQTPRILPTPGGLAPVEWLLSAILRCNPFLSTDRQESLDGACSLTI